MPSQTHAVLVDLFRSAPSLALELLSASGVAVAAARPRVLDSTFPVTSPDYHVDLAVVCEDDAGSPTLVVLVEVQLDDDPDKHFSWPLYQAAARARFRCDACVLVVAIDERVAEWARTPVSLGPGGRAFQAIVLGPSAVPHAALPTTPELAVLSALAHGATEPETLRFAVEVLDALKGERRAAYFDLLKYHLGAALDRALEANMATSERRYLSDFANNYFDQGMAAGKAEGKAEGARTTLLTVLAARGIPLGDDDRARIDACVDVATLDAWVARAARATTTAEIFAD
jgi:hypothetical protein